jgi:hypothetical protein
MKLLEMDPAKTSAALHIQPCAPFFFLPCRSDSSV